MRFKNDVCRFVYVVSGLMESRLTYPWKPLIAFVCSETGVPSLARSMRTVRSVMETSTPLLAPAVATAMRHASAVVRKQAALATLGLLRDAPLGMATCGIGSRGATEVRGFNSPYLTMRTLSMTPFRMCRLCRSSSCLRPVGGGRATASASSRQRHLGSCGVSCAR